MKLLVLVVAFAAMAWACGSTKPPDLQVPLTSPGGDLYTLSIHDVTGLVTAAHSADWRREAPSEDVTAFPERNELEVTWTGGACQHGPTIQVSGGPSALQLIVNNPDDPNWLPFLPIGCPAVGIPLTVVLTLAVPVQQDAVTLEVQWR